MTRPSELPMALATMELRKQPPPISFGDEWVLRGKHETRLNGPVIFTVLGVLGALLTAYLIHQAMISPEPFYQTTNSDGETVWSGPGLMPIFPAVCTLILLIVGLPALFMTLRRRRFGTPMLLLSQENYAPGDTVNLEFVRELQGDNVLSGGEIQFRVQCLELTEVKQGTDTTIKANPVWQAVQREPQAAGSKRLRGQFTFTIPPEKPANQSQPQHWIVWKLSVLQSVPGQFREESEYWLDVRPALATRPAPEKVGGRHG